MFCPECGTRATDLEDRVPTYYCNVCNVYWEYDDGTYQIVAARED